MNNFVEINFCDKSNQQTITKKDIRNKKDPFKRKGKHKNKKQENK